MRTMAWIGLAVAIALALALGAVFYFSRYERCVRRYEHRIDPIIARYVCRLDAKRHHSWSVG